MIKHAVLIGVNEIPGLEYLSTPSRYAIEMEDWAKKQGYHTSLFVDEPNGRAVTGKCERTLILGTIREIVQDCDQLVIYFAGHGVEHSAGNDVWLLPGYQEDPNDCISLFLNKALAYSLGVSHVVFISDACRSPSGSEALRAASGSYIFPKKNILNPNTEVDVLYSTWPGQISVDIKQNGEYRSIYSDCLLKCLNGEVPEVIHEIKNINPGFPAVLSSELNRYLKKTVPVQMTNAGRTPQYPMGDISSQDPRFLSSFTESFLISESGESDLEYKDKAKEIVAPVNRLKLRFESFSKVVDNKKASKLNRITRELIKNHEFFTSDGIFKDSETGLFVTGLSNPLVYSQYLAEEPLIWKKNYAVPQLVNYQYDEEKNGNVFLIGGSNKRFYPVNILRGLYTQVVFEKGELRTVNYYPSGGYEKQEAHHFSKEIAKRKAVIIMAAKNGIFQGDEEMASYLRSYKSLDPILGLFAAYAYFQKGNYEGVQSVYRYMEMDGVGRIIGDLRLLTVLTDHTKHFASRWEVPLPVLTEGWSYLKMLENNPYNYLSTQLEPGLWTSFNENGLNHLMDIMNFKKI